MEKLDPTMVEYTLEKEGTLSLIEAEPSVGKTGIGLHFLLSAAEKDEPCLYISLEYAEGKTSLFIFKDRIKKSKRR